MTANALASRRERPVTTIKARGLALPAPGVSRADYDQAERLGVATLKLIAAYAMRLVAGDRSVHKVVLFDEAWFLLASRDGRRLIDRLNRLGRAENATLILATQQLTDVGEIENLIGTRFIFGQETAAEARRALELLGLDPDDRALVERVRSYRRGRCLMRDIDDRVAELQIETVHEHLLRILDTSPGARHGAGGGGMTRVLILAVVFVLLAWPAAGADYRGSDVLSNIGPSSQVEGGLADKYPLSAYALDYQVDVGVADPDGVPAMIAQWAAAQLWNATSLLVKCTIDLFTWAYSLDLLGGPDGALAPVGAAITSLYENVIGQAWMVVAILLAGIWGIWKALVQRRYTETAGALGTSVLFVVIALFFVYQPERTVGQAAQWTNTVSLAFLSGANRGSLDDPERAKRQVADHLFQTLLYQPWVVLEFGGLAHCVDTDQRDPDGFPQPVAPDDPARDVCRDHITADRNGYGGYAERFLRQPPGSKARAVEATAIRDGEVPFLIRAAGRNPSPYKVDKADSPAVDIQQAGGAFQRLTFTVIVAIGAWGAVALLGFLSLAVILAQIIALVLLGFAPVALVIGIFPGPGARLLPRLAVQAGHRGLHQGPVLAGDRDRGRRQCRAHRQHRRARVPVRVRAADDLLLGAVPVPQTDQ